MAKRDSIDARIMGAEPVILEPITSVSDPRLRDALYWYGYYKDTKETKKEIYAYMKESKSWDSKSISRVRKVPHNQIVPTYANLTFMHNNGISFSDEILNKIDQYIEILLKKSDSFIEEEKEKPKTAKPSIQDRMAAVAEQYVCMFEDYEETFFESNTVPKMEVYTTLSKEQVNGPITSKILDIYTNKLDNTNEEDFFSKKKYENYVKMLNTITEEIQRWHSNVKVSAVRKPRKRKQKSAIEVVKNLNYMKQFQPLQLVSINPAEIIGVEQLWTYNHKTKQVTVYYSNDGYDLSIKGSTLINFDEKKSKRKQLRDKVIKPTLKEILTGGKIKLRRIMDNLTTKEKVVNGRINKDTILLRVVK